MKLGIIGEPYAGKTTLFELLKADQEKADKTRSNMTVVKVKDERVEYLAQGHHLPKMVFPELCFVDLQEGRAGGIAAVIPQMREMDGLILVLRVFEAPHVPAPPKGIDPLRDLKAAETELQLADLLVIEKRLERLRKEQAKGLEVETLRKAQEQLNTNLSLRLMDWSMEERKTMAGFKFVSLKPLLVIINTGEDGYGDSGKTELIRYMDTHQLPWLELCCSWEKEMAGLSPAERREFCQELGISLTGVDNLVKAAYRLLDLVSFLTIGEQEVRAWSVRAGTTAWEAAGCVHSDMQRGFIRAEVLNYERFRELGLGTFQEARKRGEIRLEGKDYIVQDGDIIHFRFHV